MKCPPARPVRGGPTGLRPTHAPLWPARRRRRRRQERRPQRRPRRTRRLPRRRPPGRRPQGRQGAPNLDAVPRPARHHTRRRPPATRRRRQRAETRAGASPPTEPDSGLPRAPRPALIVVIDEYAELADESSAVTGRAESIARRGRAVAVTLLAATQRRTQKAMGSGTVRSRIGRPDLPARPRAPRRRPHPRHRRLRRLRRLRMVLQNAAAQGSSVKDLTTVRPRTSAAHACPYAPVRATDGLPRGRSDTRPRGGKTSTARRATGTRRLVGWPPRRPTPTSRHERCAAESPRAGLPATASDPACRRYGRDGLISTTAVTLLQYHPAMAAEEARVEYDTSRRPPRVFASYSHSDREVLEILRTLLTAQGVEVRLDVLQMQPGDDLTTRMAAEVAQSDCVLAVISRHSVKSPWVDAELAQALQLEIAVGGPRVIPIRLDDCEIPPTLSRRLLRTSPLQPPWRHR